MTILNQILEIAFSGFWHFVGMTMLISIPVNALVSITSNVLRMITIMAKGWPKKDEVSAKEVFKNK